GHLPHPPFWALSEFCPLPLTASVDAGITQTPKYLILGIRDKRSLKCEQDLGDDVMYWYKQSPQKPIELMFICNYNKLNGNKSVPTRFHPECPDGFPLYLHVDALKPEDSAVYLCASSRDTALQSQLLPLHKPLASSQEAVGPSKARFPISWKTLDGNRRP
uniref:Immunoglobulin V-set domain-containing protein n=1 Tax=Catagonus wagneri TaxID=51154 RepID=A0A8C3XAI7_9CETA